MRKCKKCGREIEDWEGYIVVKSFVEKEPLLYMDDALSREFDIVEKYVCKKCDHEMRTGG